MHFMKLPSLTVALLVSLSPCTFSQQAPLAGNGHHQIRNAVEKFSQAFVVADAAILNSLLSTDYLHTNSTGSVLNKSQWLDYIKTRRRELETGRLKIESYENHDLRIRVHGETAIVTGKNVTTGKREGKPFVTELRFTHVWVREGGQWKRAAFHDSAIAK